MGLIEQSTGSTHDGLVVMAVLLVLAAGLALGLRQGGEART